MSQEHARETARVLNKIDPDYIRLRSLHVRPDIPLQHKVQQGDFEIQTEDEVVAEIGIFVDNLQVTSQLKSDHLLNLLPEIEGKIPEDKQKCLDIIDKYLALPYEERLNFRLGRRAGYYGKVADLNDSHKHDKVEEAIKRIRAQGDDIEEVALKLKNSFM